MPAQRAGPCNAARRTFPLRQRRRCSYPRTRVRVHVSAVAVAVPVLRPVACGAMCASASAGTSGIVLHPCQAARCRRQQVGGCSVSRWDGTDADGARTALLRRRRCSTHRALRAARVRATCSISTVGVSQSCARLTVCPAAAAVRAPDRCDGVPVAHEYRLQQGCHIRRRWRELPGSAELARSALSLASAWRLEKESAVPIAAPPLLARQAMCASTSARAPSR